MAAVAEAIPAAASPSRRRDALELVAVLATVALLPLATAIRWLVLGYLSRPLPLVSVPIDVFSVGTMAVLPVLCLMARDRRGWGHFGMVRPEGVDLWVAAGASLAAIVVQIVTWETLRRSSMIGSRGLSLRDVHDIQPAWSRIGLLACAAVTRGIVLRGFVMTRFLDAIPSRAAAILVAAACIAVQTASWGFASACSQVLPALVLGVIYVLGKRLWPTIVAEFLMSLIHAR